MRISWATQWEKESVNKTSFGVKKHYSWAGFFFLLKKSMLRLSKFQNETAMRCNWNIELGNRGNDWIFLLIIIFNYFADFFLVFYFWSSYLPRKNNISGTYVSFCGFFNKWKNIFLGKRLPSPQEWDNLMSLDQRRWPEPHHPVH